MNNSQYNSQSKNFKYRIQFLIFFISTLSVIIAVFFFIDRHSQNKKNKVEMLQKMAVLEGRFKQAGTFLDLYSWFMIFNEIEYRYYKYNNTFIHPDNIDSSLVKSTDPYRAIKAVRQTFWDNHIYMDSFIPPDSLKNHLYSVYGKYYMGFLSALDTKKFKTDFMLSKDKKNYKITVFEKDDITFDKDSEDYWAFSSKDSTLVFINRGNKLTNDEMIEIYTEKLFKNLPPKN